jgi:hypothetical protein
LTDRHMKYQAVTVCRYVNSGQTNFEFRYLGEFQIEFENILGCELGVQVGSFDEKKSEGENLVLLSLYTKFSLKYIIL